MNSVYKERANGFLDKANIIKNQLIWLSLVRLLAFLIFVFLIFQITQTGSRWVIAASACSFALFIFLVNRYGKLQQQKQFYTALADCNEKEDQFLQTNKSPYDTGSEYEDTQHPYSYDLDLFSQGGLYAFLNRCSTTFGKAQLAESLLQPEVSAITQRQEAIAELKDKLDFRQKLFAYGNLHPSKKKDLDRLMHWLKEDGHKINKYLYFALLIFPITTIGSLIFYLFTENETAFSLFSKLFVVNLIVAFSFSKKITSQLSVSGSVTKILKNYSNQLLMIEKEFFQSALLKNLQQTLVKKTATASQLIFQLASLFNYLETVVNLVVSLLLNGLFLFHVHILYRLGNWKKNHAHEVVNWLQIIGKTEALNSFANLIYNNSGFHFPTTISHPMVKANELGHVLVNPEKRVCNDILFDQQKFAILTGSNMSGKSTFLRTLGTNIILAKAGSAVCAKRFIFYPFDVFVSMRITDSLQDSESFFYSELKRLHAIIEHLKQNKNTFVILDEILRGTNSNDKRNGTIGLIKKMAGLNAFGIIATHDVVVAELIKDYPDFIMNKAFESAIINDELKFDYKLKDGVCTTLSATYLMRKMEII